MHEERPRLEIPWTAADKALELLALAALAAFAGTVLVWTGDLPARIPTHFGFGGAPDAWSGRAALWALPAVGLGMWIGLTWVARIPHAYNYPWAITPANAERQYTLSRRLVIALKALVCWQFLLVQLQALEVATGARAGLSIWLILSFLLGPLALIVAYLIAASRPATGP